MFGAQDLFGGDDWGALKITDCYPKNYSKIIDFLKSTGVF